MISSDKNRPAFLDQPESRRLEFKEGFPKGEQVARTAVAFANESGGRIVFGVKDEPRTIIGIPDEKIFALEEQIISCIFDLCAPPIVPEVYFQTVEEKTLLVADIFPGSEKPYYLKKYGKQNGTYIRVGSSNRKAAADTIEELERRRRKVPFDSLPVYDLTPEDVDHAGFRKSYQDFTGKKLGMTQLENMGLIRRERGRQYPTHAALLLSDSPARKRFFPYAKIECARFKGTDKRVFLDQLTIESPIHDSIESCMAFIKKNIALGSTIGEVYRKDRWEYPLEAIREALINAVIHRDYALTGSDIKMAIYDDMLEITSPGPLPDTMPIEELGTGRSEIRNRVLAPIFKDLRLIEAWGSGIQKMRQELKDYPEIDLVLRELSHTFQAQFVKKVMRRAESGPIQGRVRDKSQPELRPESQPEIAPSRHQVGTKKAPSERQLEGRVRAESGPSQGRVKAESLKERVLSILVLEPLSKAEISAKVGLKGVPGHIGRIIRELLVEGKIEFTIPEKPNSRMQKYRIKR